MFFDDPSNSCFTSTQISFFFPAAQSVTCETLSLQPLIADIFPLTTKATSKTLLFVLCVEMLDEAVEQQ